MCLKETYRTGRLGKHLPDIVLLRMVLKKGDALSPLLLNFALGYAFRWVQLNRGSLTLNGSH